MIKDLKDKIDETYPKTIHVYPREKFCSQLTGYLRKMGYEK